MFIGVLLLLIGSLMVLEKLGIIHGSAWDFLLPAALIALGANFVFRGSRKCN